MAKQIPIPDQPIPVTVLTGFLGAGKTTFLNYVLSQQKDYKVAVIINEIGAVNVDSGLVQMEGESMLEFSNGCICCTVRSDLVKSILNLLRKTKFDYVIIEPTGLADPGPIAQTFLNIPELQAYVRLDSIVAIVDAQNFFDHFTASPTTQAQIEMADFIILNKTDCADAKQLSLVQQAITKLNPHATVHPAVQGRIDLKHVWDVNAFRLDEKLAIRPNLLDETIHKHDERIKAHSLIFDKPFDMEKLQECLRSFSEKYRIIRSKGFLGIKGETHRMVFHGVNDRYSLYWDRGVAPAGSQMVFIGENIPIQTIEKDLKSALV